MQEQVAILLELMGVDERLRALKRRVEAQAAEKQRRQMEADLVRNGLAQEQARLTGAEKRQREAAREIEIAQSRKREAEHKLSAVKTNDEYRALLKEIAAAEERVQRQEEAILQILDEQEAARRTIEAVKTEFQQKEQEAAVESGRYESDLAAARTDQQSLIAERAALIERLPAGLRGRYERLWGSKGDTAIVAVRQGACSGCHYRLPPQLVNEVRGGQRLLLCEGCGRILVWPANS